MKAYKTLVILFFLLMVLIFPCQGHAITTLSLSFQDRLRLISLDMPRKEVIETLGTPDIIKSEGMCYQYESVGLSIFFNQNDQVEQIYLSRNFTGSLGGKRPMAGITLQDIEREFGNVQDVKTLNYQPSPIIRTKATTETENQTDPTGRVTGDFPLQYPGDRRLYMFFTGGKPLKNKYVLDREGIAFWFDHAMQLYATVLYTQRVVETVAELPIVIEPAAEREKQKVSRKIRLTLVHFDFDKSLIKKIDIPELDKHVAVLNEVHPAPVTVEGHTDYRGSDAYNQRLSERRAAAVRRYLIEKGIASDRIKTVGYGEQRPVADNKTVEGRALNRRVELEATVESYVDRAK